MPLDGTGVPDFICIGLFFIYSFIDLISSSSPLRLGIISFYSNSASSAVTPRRHQASLASLLIIFTVVVAAAAAVVVVVVVPWSG